jgi:hypothetical protein
MFRGTSRTPGIEDLSFDWEWESVTVCDVIFHQLLKEFNLLDYAFVVAKFDCCFDVLCSFQFFERFKSPLLSRGKD